MNCIISIILGLFLQIQANAQVVNNISGEPPQHNNESKLATESGMEDFFS